MSAQTPQTDEFRSRLFDALGDSPKSRESQWDTYARDLEADRDRLKALCEELREALITCTAACIAVAEKYPGELPEYEAAIWKARTALKKAQKDI